LANPPKVSLGSLKSDVAINGKPVIKAIRQTESGQVLVRDRFGMLRAAARRRGPRLYLYDKSGWQIGFTEGTRAPGETLLFDTTRVAQVHRTRFEIVGHANSALSNSADGHAMLIGFSLGSSPAVSNVTSSPSISNYDDSGRDCSYVPSWSLSAIYRSGSLSELNKHLLNLVSMRFSHDFGPHLEDVFWQSNVDKQCRLAAMPRECFRELFKFAQST